MTVVARRVLTDLDGLVEKMGVAYRDDVPEYGALSPTVMNTEVLPVSRRIVEQFFEDILLGQTPDATKVAEVAVMGRRRLEMGIPLEPMLHVYRVAGRVVWDAIVAATHSGEEAALATLGAQWMDYIDRAASMAAAAYLAASHERIRAVDARRRALLEGLLSATDAAEVAAVSIRFSTALASAYVPVIIDGEEASAAIDRILAAAPEATIGGPFGGRILLLVPAPLDDVNPLWRSASRAVLAWGQPATPGPDLLGEVGHVESVVAAALARGSTSGAYGPDDLLLDQLVAGNDRVRAALHRRVQATLAGRDHDGLITATLRTYLLCGSVPETARRDHVHANTILYRLKRVKELTGLDPRIPAEAAVLVLAVGR